MLHVGGSMSVVLRLVFGFYDYDAFIANNLGLGAFEYTGPMVFWACVGLGIVVAQNVMLAIVSQACEFVSMFIVKNFRSIRGTTFSDNFFGHLVSQTTMSKLKEILLPQKCHYGLNRTIDWVSGVVVGLYHDENISKMMGHSTPKNT